MEFNQLESFLAIIRYKSFSKAAKELYLTQPTISNNIQNLENELKTTLLDRRSRTITLTDSGKALYEYAIELINIRDQAKFNIIEYSNTIEGEIEISSSTIPEQYILPYIIRDFTSLYPGISFSVNHKSSRDIIDDILEGKQNFGIVGAKYNSRVLEYIDFYKDKLVLAVPNNYKYPLSSDDFLDIDVLFSEKFLFRKEGSGTRLFIEKYLCENNISMDDLNILYSIDSNEMIKKMISLGLGVSFVSEVALQNEIALRQIKPFKIKGLNLERDFYFVYNKHKTLSPIVEIFRDFIRDWSYTP